MPASRSRIRVRPERLSAASRRSYGVPEYWEDRRQKCRVCGDHFLFTAIQQQTWYEEQGKNLDNQPVRCVRCFLEYSQRRRLKARMDYALGKLRESPGDETRLEAVETIIGYYQQEKHGDLELALHLAREVFRERPGNRRAQELIWIIEALRST